MPIIACSAFESSENVRECIESGMDMYIKKPVTLDKIQRVFSSFLQVMK